jgi:hypothetical protein
MIDKLFRTAGIGVAVGAGLVIFGPPLIRAVRPLARQAMKTAIIGYAEGREALAHLQELAEDAYAEAVGELVAETAEGDAAKTVATNGSGSPGSVNG